MRDAYARFEVWQGKSERPDEDEANTFEQLSVMKRLIDHDQLYVDFAIVGQFGNRAVNRIRMIGLVLGCRLA